MTPESKHYIFHGGYVQFYGLVPVDDVAGENKRLEVEDVNIALLRPNVQPLALEW